MQQPQSPLILAAGKYLRLLKVGTWEFAERTSTIVGAVVIVAVTNDGKLILTEQYRVPLANNVIELPAGLVGDEPEHRGEPLVNAAKRELLEETGYEADHWEMLTEGPTSAGMTNERVTIFRATGLRKIHAGGGDAQEAITVHEIPLATVPDWLTTQAARGIPCDAKVYAGLYFVQR